MITGKQRSYLKKLSHGIRPAMQLGKEGITENFINQYEVIIEANELVKINVLDSSPLDAKEAAHELAERTKSEFVQAIGRKCVLYRRAQEEPEIRLPK